MTKLTLCLLGLILTLISCDTALRPSESHLKLSVEDPHKDIAQFFEAFFKYFDLDRPNQIIYECFSAKTAAIYIEMLYGYGKILQDLHDRDSCQVHLDLAKEYFLGLLEHTTSDCIVQTQDLSDLFDALGVKRDPLMANIGYWLYYQAHFEQMYEDFKPVIQNLDAKNFSAAGEAYAAQTKTTIDTITKEGLYYMAHTGFANGFAIELDIDLPSDSLSAWNDTTAEYDIQFIVEAARAVAEGKWWESSQNLEKFWHQKGKDIFEKIPKSVWESLEGSEDNKKVIGKLGIDILSEEFEKLMLGWIVKHPLKYHHYAKLLVKNFDGFNFVHAGSLHADLVKEIAKSR